MSNDRAKPRVLIVDSDGAVIESLSKFLRLEGYEPASAGSFAAALAELEERRYDFVITDTCIPGAGDLELLRAIRARFGDVIVVVVTSSGTIQTAIEAMKLGAYDYLTKPITDDQIRLTIERALHRYPRRSTYEQ